jgi:hypothetical protein
MFMLLTPVDDAVIVTLRLFSPVSYCAETVPAEDVTSEVAANVPPAPLSEKLTVTPGTG